MGDSHHNSISALYVGILGVISGSILVAFIHCIVVNCRTRILEPTTSPPRPPEMHRRPRVRVQRDFSASLSFPSTASSGSSSSGGSSITLTVHKYTKEFKEGTCVVCLGEFEENEDVRIMPECAHIFHVSCIDMWLFSHTNCPLCRANAAPRPHDVLLSILNSTTVSSTT